MVNVNNMSEYAEILLHRQFFTYELIALRHKTRHRQGLLLKTTQLACFVS